MSELPFSPRHFSLNPFAHFPQMGLGKRLALHFLPVPLLVAVGLFAFTYHQVQGTLSTSMAEVSSVGVHAMGQALSQLMLETRNQIATLASGSTTVDELRQRLRRRTHRLLAMGDNRLREVAFSGTGQYADTRYLWITSRGQIFDIDPESLSVLNNSALHFNITPGEHEILLSQPVDVTYPAVSDENNKARTVNMQVVRFTAPVTLSDGTFAGYLVLSLDLQALRQCIASLSMDDAIGNTPSVLFVDREGWMLFQMRLDGTTDVSSLDSARAGQKGTFDRVGFSQAFRPNPEYYGYWTMINDLRSGKTGQFFTSAMPWNEGDGAPDTVSYAPVRYVSGHGAEPVTLGGVVILDTSFAGTALGSQLRHIWLGACCLALVLMMIACWRIARAQRRFMDLLAADVENAAEKSITTPLPERTEPSELFTLRHGINEILKQKRALEDELDALDNLECARVLEEEVRNMPRDVDVPKDGIIGVSREINLVREDIRRAASSSEDVLIMGETGTGKELISHAIHNLSSRRDGPFITINCGALDESLLMDILFGHVKGAYTGSPDSRKGAFLAACGGTLMLDEVGTASPKVQTALLRALSERCIYPLGSDTKVPFDTRVIAATNADLQADVAEGKFRQDLYFRLAVITIRTPPLRQRKRDIPYLIVAFLKQNLQNSSTQRHEPGISRGALSRLMHYHWPGNIRELRNVINRALAFCDGKLIQSTHLRLGEEHAAAQERIVEECKIDLRKNEEVQRDETLRSTTTPAASKSELESRESMFWSTTDPAANFETDITSTPSGRKGRELSGRLDRILPQLCKAGEFSRKDYQEIARVSMRTAQYDLQELQNAGLVQRIGRARTQRYVIINTTDNNA